MFHDTDLDAAMARFHELDAEAGADDAWNRADRAGRELALAIATGHVAEIRPADDIVMDDRRPLVSLTYVGRDAVIEGFSTTGTTRPWRAEFETLAVRGNDHRPRWRSDGRRSMTPASSSNSSPSTGSTATV